MTLFITGRPAWIASLILGIILLVVGLIIGNGVLITAGIAFAAIGLLFLILSFVTGGAAP